MCNKPSMTNWYHPRVLLKTLKYKIISEIFGWYSDRRLINAALDHQNDYNPIELTREHLNKNGDIWIDYVADTGDGFDATYTVAYHLSREKLQTKKYGNLYRGNIIIFGGDQVYPYASRENYENRFQEPYEAAFSNKNFNSKNDFSNIPFVFLLPGNHDWYDGLTLFTAKFCKGDQIKFNQKKPIWRLKQTRSYFAIKLPYNWWIFGLDTQLDNDIDTPQHNYFDSITKTKVNISKEAKIIICASTPSWLEADSDKEKLQEHFKRTIDHVATKIIKKNVPHAKIYTVISGDTHHYSRYRDKNSKTEFIISGGGGGYTSPTHQLKKTIVLNWLGEKNTVLEHAKKCNDAVKDSACYPSKRLSKKMRWNNWIKIIMSILPIIILTLIILLGLVFCKAKCSLFIIGVLAFFGIVYTLCSLCHKKNKKLLDWAFAAIRSTSYKNFLRMHIREKNLTIYVIGIPKSQTKEKWASGTSENTDTGFEIVDVITFGDDNEEK